MLHAGQSFLAHKALFQRQNSRGDPQFNMEPQQDVPLNLTCRKTQEMPVQHETVFNSKQGLECNEAQRLGFVSWCFPWINCPLIPITEESLRPSQAYWNLLHAILPGQLRLPERQVVPAACPDYHGMQSNEGARCSLTPRVQDQDKTGDESFSAQPTQDKDRNRKLNQKQKKVLPATKPYFKCAQCGVSYPHRFELNRHIKVSHVRPHRCERCGKRFGHKNYLQVHIETVHFGRKSHKCEMCGKYLSTGGNLSVHVRTIHMGEKKYKCSICGRTFGQQCNMKTHMKRHFFKQQ